MSSMSLVARSCGKMRQSQAKAEPNQSRISGCDVTDSAGPHDTNRDSIHARTACATSTNMQTSSSALLEQLRIRSMTCWNIMLEIALAARVIHRQVDLATLMTIARFHILKTAAVSFCCVACSVVTRRFGVAEGGALLWVAHCHNLELGALRRESLASLKVPGVSRWQA